MSDKNKKVIILHFQKESDQSAGLRTLEKAYEKHTNIDVFVVPNGNEAAQIMNEYSGGLLLFSIYDKVCITQLLTFINSSAPRLKDGTIKMAGYNNLPSKKIDKFLQKNNCAEQFYDKITSKTLAYKINLWFKAIDFSSQKVEEEKKRQESLKATDITFIKQLDLESDCWLLDSKDQIHNAMKQWFIYMTGPSPCAGSWDEIENKNDHYDKYWEWIPKLQGKFPFITDAGSWIFKGPRPSFSWKDNIWHFTGRDIYLGFQSADTKKIHYRFTANSDGAKITENSDAAKFKRPLIEESCNPEYHVDSEGFYENKKNFNNESDEQDSEANKFGQNNNALDSHLKGNNYEENSISTNYEGNLSSNNMASLDTESNTDIELSENLADIKKDIENNLNNISTLYRGKTNNSSLAIEKDNKDENTKDNESKETSQTKTDQQKTDLLISKITNKEKQYADNKNQTEDEKKALAKSIQLALSKQKENKNEREGYKDKISTDMVGTFMGKKIEIPDPFMDEDDIENDDLASAIEELKKKTDINLKAQEKRHTPNESYTDQIDSNYQSKNNGKSLNPLPLSANKKGDQKSDDENNTKSNNQINNLTPILPGNSKKENHDSKRSANHATPQSRLAALLGGVPGLDDLDATDSSNVDTQNTNMMGKGMRDQINEDDLEGDGAKADYIEKYYGRKSRHQNDDESKSHQRDFKKDLKIKTDNSTFNKHHQFGGMAKDFNLFGKDRVNISDIKLSIELIRKGKSSKIFDDVYKVELSDLFENYVVIKEKVRNIVATGEKVLIKIDSSYLGQNSFFDLAGIVEEIEAEESVDSKINDQFANITIKLTKFDQNDLNSIMRIFMERQANIITFFKAAKGIE